MNISELVQAVNGKVVERVELWDDTLLITKLHLNKQVELVLEGEYLSIEFSSESEELVLSPDAKVNSFNLYLEDEVSVEECSGEYYIYSGKNQYDIILREEEQDTKSIETEGNVTVMELGNMSISQLNSTKLSDL